MRQVCPATTCISLLWSPHISSLSFPQLDSSPVYEWGAWSMCEEHTAHYQPPCSCFSSAVQHSWVGLNEYPALNTHLWILGQDEEMKVVKFWQNIPISLFSMSWIILCMACLLFAKLRFIFNKDLYIDAHTWPFWGKYKLCITVKGYLK